MQDLIPLLKEFGFPIVLCGVLMWAIFHMAKRLAAESKAHIASIKDQHEQFVASLTDQNKRLITALNTRIDTLEKVLEERDDTIKALHSDRLKRSDSYATDIKDVMSRYAKVLAEHDAWSKQAFGLLSRLIDAWQDRPCMYRPHAPSKPPSSADLPSPPSCHRDHA